MHRFLTILLFITLSQPVWSESLTGKQLQEACTITMRVNDNSYISGSPAALQRAKMSPLICNTYITATNDAILFTLQLLKSIPNNPMEGKLPYCMDNVSDDEKIKKVVTYLNETPSAMSGSAIQATYDAFVKYFPCK